LDLVLNSVIPQESCRNSTPEFRNSPVQPHCNGLGNSGRARVHSCRKVPRIRPGFKPLRQPLVVTLRRPRVPHFSRSLREVGDDGRRDRRSSLSRSLPRPAISAAGEQKSAPCLSNNQRNKVQPRGLRSARKAGPSPAHELGKGTSSLVPQSPEIAPGFSP